MMIGSSSKRKIDDVLLKIAELSKGDITRRVSIHEVNDTFGLDRKEIKNVLGYLNQMKLIEPETIGGPLLYGHVSITEDGLEKAGEIKNNSD